MGEAEGIGKMRTSMGMILLATIALASTAMSQDQSCAEGRVEYRTIRPDASLILINKLPQGTEAPTGESVKSPQGTLWYFKTVPDFMKPGPWTTEIFVADNHGAFLKFTFPNHGNAGIKADWLNEKLLFLQAWPGRIASIDMIYDIGAGRFIYAEEAHYGAITFCKEPGR